MFELVGAFILLAPLFVGLIVRPHSNPPSIILAILIWVSAIEIAALICLLISSYTVPVFVSVYVVVYSLLFVLGKSDIGEKDSHGLLATFIIALILLGLERGRLLGIPLGGDAIAYHLPMAAQWVQAQSFFVQDSRVWFYPGSYELLVSAFFLMVGSDSLWQIADITSVFLVCYSVCAILQRLKVDQITSVLLMMTIVISPLITRTIGAGDNDLWVLGLTLSMLLGIVLMIQGEVRIGIPIFILSMGLLASAKYSSLPWIVLAVPAFYFVFVSKNRQSVLRIFVFTLCAFFLVFSFLLRNFILTDNPFYPVGLWPFFEWGDTSHLVTKSPPITEDEISDSSMINQSISAWVILGKHVFNLAPFFCISFLLLAIGVVRAVIKRQKLYMSGISWVLLAGTLISLFVFLTQPLVAENIPGTLNQLRNSASLRFALSSLVLGTFLFLCNTRAQFPILNAAIIAAGSALVVDDLGLKTKIIISIVIILFFASKIPAMFGRIVAYGLLVALISYSFFKNSNETKIESAFNYYTYGGKTDLIRKLKNETCPNQTIISSTSLRAWPMIGSDLGNRVISVGLTEKASVYRFIAKSENADLVVVSKENGDFNSPTYLKYPIDIEEFSREFDPIWKICFQDEFVTVFSRSKGRFECCI